MSAERRWLRIGATAAFAAAASALLAAVAAGITEPTGIATVVAVIATVIAYGVAPLVIAFAMRQSALSSWWGVAAALLATVLWSMVALLLAAPAIVVTAPALITAIIGSAPSSSALWILVASVEVVVRAGMPRWSLVVVAGFVAVLMIGSVLIELSGFDIRKVLVPLGWAVWMSDIGGALRSRMSSASPPPTTHRAERCANCGAPRRQDGLAFCSDCGLPYGVGKTGS